MDGIIIGGAPKKLTPAQIAANKALDAKLKKEQKAAALLQRQMIKAVPGKTGMLAPACGGPGHAHIWITRPNIDRRRMQSGKIDLPGQEGKTTKNQRARTICDDFTDIRICSCGACQVSHLIAGWCPLTSRNYFMTHKGAAPVTEEAATVTCA